MVRLVSSIRWLPPLVWMTAWAAEPAAPQAVSVLEVSVDPCPRDGFVRLALFEDPHSFPDEPIESVVLPAGLDLPCASASPESAAEAPVALWRFTVAPGAYAVAVIHDRNGNGRLDTNFLGMPTEPYGFSQGARGRFGPPSFEDASVAVEPPFASVRVEMR